MICHQGNQVFISGCTDVAKGNSLGGAITNTGGIPATQVALHHSGLCRGVCDTSSWTGKNTIHATGAVLLYDSDSTVLIHLHRVMLTGLQAVHFFTVDTHDWQKEIITGINNLYTQLGLGHRLLILD